jgi:multidrug efflux pump subunit AcrB
VELGAENYFAYSTLNGKNATSIGIYQLPGANSINIAKTVRTKVEELSKRFPAGMKYYMVYDTTMFVKEYDP